MMRKAWLIGWNSSEGNEIYVAQDDNRLSQCQRRGATHKTRALNGNILLSVPKDAAQVTCPPIILGADHDGIQDDAIAFIPKHDEKWESDLPCILGLLGCLEHFRFAVDPMQDMFYFGELT